ncbi:unnamed protein product [marine sediment metagenome]|uniref:Uncharacterized protein n=1 Tax=marine sediment metagenome TaxID=412755 RepID=X1SKE0_9ZZZZ
MVEELGKEKSTRLMKYEGVVSLTQKGATEVLETIWPDAPEVEVFKAAMVCHQYGLNPLMHHLFLIPFKRRRQGRVVGEDWVTVLGIKATRLIAHRHGDFSYLDDTPRVMTDEEQKRIYGSVDSTKIMAITKLKDSKGNEASGYGAWPLGEEPYEHILANYPMQTCGYIPATKTPSRQNSRYPSGCLAIFHEA